MIKYTKKFPKHVALSLKEREGLNYFAARLKGDLDNSLIEVKLYGSRARGDAGPNSDIDVLVVLKKDSERKKMAVYDRSVETLRKYGVLLSEHIMNEKQYLYEKKLPSLFLQFVEREGISLL